MSDKVLLSILVLFFAAGIYLYVVSQQILKKFRKNKGLEDNSTAVILGIVVLLIIFVAPWWLTSWFDGWVGDYGDTGEIGDTIGGLTAPFIGGLSAVLVYLALRAQIEANKLVNDQFKIQQFESRFFELLKLHRDNVAEIGIGDDFGKKIFVSLIREFRLIHHRLLKYKEEENLILGEDELMEISYLILFFGFGPNSSRQLKIALQYYGEELFDLLELKFNNRDIKKAAQKERKLKYIPFEGHQSRLGHYFRHLFQTVDYIDKRDINVDKYSYVKALRAQLTTHEQALLFINSISNIGKRWWDNDFIVKYGMVKNIPPGFFDPEKEIDIESKFDIGYFEYQEENE